MNGPESGPGRVAVEADDLGFLLVGMARDHYKSPCYSAACSGCQVASDAWYRVYNALPPYAREDVFDALLSARLAMPVPSNLMVR